jgi:hypothetical protein
MFNLSLVNILSHGNDECHAVNLALTQFISFWLQKKSYMQTIMKLYIIKSFKHYFKHKLAIVHVFVSKTKETIPLHLRTQKN